MDTKISHTGTTQTNLNNTQNTTEKNVGEQSSAVGNARAQTSKALQQIRDASSPEELRSGLQAARINAEVMYHHGAYQDARDTLRHAHNLTLDHLERPSSSGILSDEDVRKEFNTLMDKGQQYGEFDTPRLRGGGNKSSSKTKRGDPFTSEQIDSIVGKNHKRSGSSAQPIYSPRTNKGKTEHSYPHISNTKGDAHMTDMFMHRTLGGSGSDRLATRVHQRNGSPNFRADRTAIVDKDGQVYAAKNAGKLPRGEVLDPSFYDGLTPTRGAPRTNHPPLTRREMENWDFYNRR